MTSASSTNQADGSGSMFAHGRARHLIAVKPCLQNDAVVRAISRRLPITMPLRDALVQAHIDANDAVANRVGHVTPGSVAAEVRAAQPDTVRAYERGCATAWEDSDAAHELYWLHHLFLIVSGLCTVPPAELRRATHEWHHALVRSQSVRPRRRRTPEQPQPSASPRGADEDEPAAKRAKVAKDETAVRTPS